MRRWFERLATVSQSAWNSRRWATCLWPGLPQLWYDGSWRGLAAAVAFAAAVNGLLAVSLVWYELASPTGMGVGWLLAAFAWMASAVVSWRWLACCQRRNQRQLRVESAEDLYPAAMNEYLKRNFVAAERHLLELLAADGRDCAAGLLLASVWRRTGRIGDARGELARLSRLEAAGPWMLEIERDLKLLDEEERRTADEAHDKKHDENQGAKDQTKAA